MTDGGRLLCAVSVVLTAAGVACGPTDLASRIPANKDPRASSVLVIQNGNAPEGVDIARYYAKKRGIPIENVVTIKTTADENISRSAYEAGIRDVVRAHITAHKLDIDFIVLTRGVPIRLDNDTGYSLDAFLMVDAHPSRKGRPMEPLPMPANPTEGDLKLDPAGVRRVFNPYFGSKAPFDSDKYGFYLCTRLDGYTKEDAMALVDRSLKAGAANGEFLLDASPDKGGGPSGITQRSMLEAGKLLKAKGFKVRLDETNEFVGSRADLMGYASWGSNDGDFSRSAYNSLGFRPGAIAETYVSTSARTFRVAAGGQSLIADLVRQGVTGAKGYVSEPFTVALARVDLLFDRYTGGLNLAESFYAASPLLKWKDLVIGDPLCAPYRRVSSKQPSE